MDILLIFFIASNSYDFKYPRTMIEFRWIYRSKPTANLFLSNLAIGGHEHLCRKRISMRAITVFKNYGLYLRRRFPPSHIYLGSPKINRFRASSLLPLSLLLNYRVQHINCFNSVRKLCCCTELFFFRTPIFLALALLTSHRLAFLVPLKLASKPHNCTDKSHFRC